MKKTSTLFFSVLFYLSLTAQAPQGINYQAIAYDNLGQPVNNQTVGVRLSVLDGGANGSVLYSETQSPNTDNTGLFSIVIGNGTIVSGTFAGINWGNGARWLKTEIDIVGGNNYVVMGSSQFMSTPYAFYADQAGNTGVSLEFPDGIDNITPVQLDTLTNYIVPSGKNLYVSGWYVKIDSAEFGGNFYTPLGRSPVNFVGASPGSKVKTSGSSYTGFLVNKTVDWITINIACQQLDVPPGKIFIARCGYAYDPSLLYLPVAFLNGKEIRDNISFLMFKNGDVLTTNASCATGAYFITGYFRNN